MIKSELIQKLADENPNLYHRDVERIVSIIFDEITQALAQGDRVEHRPSRVGRNPRSGEAVAIEEKWSPYFKAGKEMRERLNK